MNLHKKRNTVKSSPLPDSQVELPCCPFRQLKESCFYCSFQVQIKDLATSSEEASYNFVRNFEISNIFHP